MAAVEAPSPKTAGDFALGLPQLLAGASRAAGARGWPGVARTLAQTALRMDPCSADAQLALGKALVRSRRYDHALPYLQASSGHEGAARRGSWELARLLLRLERSDASPATIAEYRERLMATLRTASLSSDRAIKTEALLLISCNALDLGDSDTALAAAQTAMDIVPGDQRTRVARANALLAAGSLGPATREFEILSAESPDDNLVAKSAAIASELSKPSRKTAAEEVRPLPLLIAVGGGIGDLLHATPLVRNVARRTGAAVDVLVAADHAGTGFLFENRRYVRKVWAVSPQVLTQHYRRVLLTYSFGPLRLPFRAEEVLVSRSWRPFRPGHLNESVFNLEAAKALIGVPYDREDAARYFAGELAWLPAPTVLVGLHAGSKGGRWLSKRWPHFPRLVARLKAQGVAVASFGTADEYVEGSENRTGGSIEQMTRAMLDCSIFVSNDSGAMHIASALGMPVLALYAPTDPFTHMPLGSNVTALALEKPCAPCEVKNHAFFTTGACRCVSEIPVEAVERTVLKLLLGDSEDAQGPAEACE